MEGPGGCRTVCYERDRQKYGDRLLAVVRRLKMDENGISKIRLVRLT